jgi:hypothetical protein
VTTAVALCWKRDLPLHQPGAELDHRCHLGFIRTSPILTFRVTRVNEKIHRWGQEGSP